MVSHLGDTNIGINYSILTYTEGSKTAEKNYRLCFTGGKWEIHVIIYKIEMSFDGSSTWGTYSSSTFKSSLKRLELDKRPMIKVFRVECHPEID